MYAQPSNYSSPITPDQVAVLTNTGRGLILNNQSVEETEKKEDQLINHVSKSHQSVIRINRDPPPRVRRARGEKKSDKNDTINGKQHLRLSRTRQRFRDARCALLCCTCRLYQIPHRIIERMPLHTLDVYERWALTRNLRVRYPNWWCETACVVSISPEISRMHRKINLTRIVIRFRNKNGNFHVFLQYNQSYTTCNSVLCTESAI